MAAPRLEFRDITFTIAVKGGVKPLLRGVTGECAPGQVTALSGPSGGGKTTFLAALAGCEYGGRLSGEVLVDGQPAGEWRKANTAAYVHQHVRPPACLSACCMQSAALANAAFQGWEQWWPAAVPPALPQPLPPTRLCPQDVLPTLDTPREALTLAALLRLPPSMSRARKLRRVDELLEVLVLGGCADIMIGDSTYGSRGLSGGQRRRVTTKAAEQAQQLACVERAGLAARAGAACAAVGPAQRQRATSVCPALVSARPPPCPHPLLPAHAVGIELVKSPSLLLLDEPLSGGCVGTRVYVLCCMWSVGREKRGADGPPAPLPLPPLRPG